MSEHSPNLMSFGIVQLQARERRRRGLR